MFFCTQYLFYCDISKKGNNCSFHVETTMATCLLLMVGFTTETVILLIYSSLIIWNGSFSHVWSVCCLKLSENHIGCKEIHALRDYLEYVCWDVRKSWNCCYIGCSQILFRDGASFGVSSDFSGILFSSHIGRKNDPSLHFYLLPGLDLHRWPNPVSLQAAGTHRHYRSPL